MAGFVYVMSNPGMPKLLKIGKTSKDPSTFRLDELYTTGVPFPFECEYYIYVADCDWLERNVFAELEEFRPNPKREFFEVNCSEAIKAIQKTANERKIFIFEQFPNEPCEKQFAQNQFSETDSFLEEFRLKAISKQKNTDNFRVKEARRQRGEPIDEVGQTALHRAAILGDSLKILTLLDAGASKNIKDDYGKTPWDYAKLNEKVTGTTAYYALKGSDH
jgi:hypothetical protein